LIAGNVRAGSGLLLLAIADKSKAAITKRAIEDFFIRIPLSIIVLRQNFPILTFNTIIRRSYAKIKNKAEYLQIKCK
jgi:hypothetical protein